MNVLKIAAVIVVAVLAIIGLWGEHAEQRRQLTVTLSPGQTVERTSPTLDRSLVNSTTGCEPTGSITFCDPIQVRPVRIEAPDFVTVNVSRAEVVVELSPPGVNQTTPTMDEHSYVTYTVHAKETAPAGEYNARIVFPAYNLDVTVQINRP